MRITIMGFLIKQISNFAKLTRAYSLGAVLGTCCIIFSYAFYCEKFNFTDFILLVVALCCIQLGANLFDDYIDVKLKMKDGTALQDINFDGFAPKAELIRNGTYSFSMVRIILVALFTIAVLTGFYFTLLSGWKILLFILAGGLLIMFYPVSSKYYLSEAIVGLAFGPLMITGGYYALCKGCNTSLFLLSWAIFFSTLVLLHTHHLMDWEFDVKAGKKTLCILSGDKPRAISALRGMIIASYMIVVIGVLASLFNPKMLYVFLTLPIATKLISSMKEYICIKDVKFEPRWYWGIFENWKEIQNNRIDFFMFRFYLARNFSFFFALFATIGAMT